MTRDFAYVVDRAVTYAQIESCLRACPRLKNLRSCELFDVYQGKQLDAGKKSMALNLFAMVMQEMAIYMSIF